MVCRCHSTSEQMKPVGQGWGHEQVEGSDACILISHLGEKCDGENKDCPDYVEKVVPSDEMGPKKKLGHETKDPGGPA